MGMGSRFGVPGIIAEVFRVPCHPCTIRMTSVFCEHASTYQWEGCARLKGKEIKTERPGANLKEVDISQERLELSKQLEGRKVDDEDLFGYLMYPAVFLDYMGRHRNYGPVRTIPTNTFFYGMSPGLEIEISRISCSGGVTC